MRCTNYPYFFYTQYMLRIKEGNPVDVDVDCLLLYTLYYPGLRQTGDVFEKGVQREEVVVNL